MLKTAAASELDLKLDQVVIFLTEVPPLGSQTQIRHGLICNAASVITM